MENAAELLHVDPNALRDSPYQRRRDLKLTPEFVESVRRHIAQPLVARRVPAPAPKVGEEEFELLHGHRRKAGAIQAERATVPIVIYDGVTNTEARAILLLENLQREDLTPLEESEGYVELYADGWNAAEIAARVFKPERYVARRLNLRHLAPKSVELLREGKLTAGQAEILARIPDAKVQEEAAKRVCANELEGPLPIAATLEHVRDNCMLRLDEAQFSKMDPDLVAAAGTCGACPKRTGSQALLFDDVPSPDLCTDPSCFKKKQGVYVKRELVQLRKLGMVVLKEDRDVRALTYGYDPKLVNFEQAHPFDPKHRTWAQLMVGVDPTPAKMLVAVHPENGRLHYGAKRKDADGWVALAGHLKLEGKRASPVQDGDDKKANEQEKVRRLAVTMSLEALSSAGEVVGEWSRAQWFEVACAVLSGFDYAADRVVRRRSGQKADRAVDALTKLMKKANKEELASIVVELLASDGVNGGEGSSFRKLCAVFGVDWKAKERAARGELRERKKKREQPKAPKRARKVAK